MFARNAMCSAEVAMKQESSLSIVGSGGDGAVAAGDILSLACASQGLNVIKTEAYGPQIRGGESSCTVRLSTAPIFAQAGSLDALVIFNWKDYARFRDELVPAADAVLFHEAADAPPPGTKGQLVAVPFTQMMRDSSAPGSKNMIALGLLASFFALPLDPIRAAVRQRFGRKSPAIVDANLRSLDLGVAFWIEKGLTGRPLAISTAKPRLLMSGNETAAYAALHAGCTFFAGYPITPSSEILQFLGEWMPKFGATCVQTEDELSAIGAVVGASFAGAKSMTATSGPGLSLMAEMLGLASIAEIPAVIVDVQRGGPSTGIPTKSEQSDLLHAVYASHGDTPRVVLACSDVEDAFHATVEAFNLAEEYQMPVIVLSDQMVAQRKETIDAASLTHEVRDRKLALGTAGGEYRRYAETEDGISPMSIPGMAEGIYQTSGLEHDQSGRPTAMYSDHEAMNAKRYRKMQSLVKRPGLVHRLGAERPELGILCWGSSLGPVREALEMMTKSGRRVAAFAPRMLSPLPADELQAFVDSCDQLLIIELSYSAQFHQYLRSGIDLPRGKTTVLARSGGRALSVSEVVEKCAELLKVEMAEEVMA